MLDYLNAIATGNILPDLIGPDTLQLLKENDRYSNIPVIIHSTSENATEKANCLRIGAAYYLYKGWGYDKLVGQRSFFMIL